jgi:hAT family C-terminal dimerisation region
MKNRVRISLSKFDHHYRKMQETAVYAAATILHPFRKAQYIERNWKRDLQQPALESSRMLWEKYRVGNPLRGAMAFNELGAFDLAARDLDVGSLSRNDEYELYLSQAHIQIADSALSWWLLDTQRQTWPRLARMAIDILSIPAMSDKPERLFSGIRRTVAWETIKYGSEEIEKTECLKHWRRCELVSSEDILSLLDS